MQVSDIMEPNVVTVLPDAPVLEAIATMSDGQVTGLPVVDVHGKLVGVISTSDVLGALAETTDATAREVIFEGTRVDELMSRRPFTIGRDADLKDAAEQMLYLDVHRLFVVENGQLVGVISQTDIARAVATART